MASRGPVWNRPLRKKRTSLFICRRGGCPHPPDRFQASGGRSDPRGRPCRMRNQISLPFVGAAHRAARAFPLQGGRCRANARRMRVTFSPESSMARGPRTSPTHRGWTFWRTVGEGQAPPEGRPVSGPYEKRTASVSAVGAGVLTRPSSLPLRPTPLVKGPIPPVRGKWPKAKRGRDDVAKRQRE